ncbi:hypothetical protein GCM10018789_33830 [Streptomyces werraensis]|nr:hypothetical protein GCM10018789_33830 [Streptomyces werraensis]
MIRVRTTEPDASRIRLGSQAYPSARSGRVRSIKGRLSTSMAGGCPLALTGHSAEREGHTRPGVAQTTRGSRPGSRRGGRGVDYGAGVLILFLQVRTDPQCQPTSPP